MWGCCFLSTQTAVFNLPAEHERKSYLAQNSITATHPTSRHQGNKAALRGTQVMARKSPRGKFLGSLRSRGIDQLWDSGPEVTPYQ